MNILWYFKSSFINYLVVLEWDFCHKNFILKPHSFVSGKFGAVNTFIRAMSWSFDPNHLNWLWDNFPKCFLMAISCEKLRPQMSQNLNIDTSSDFFVTISSTALLEIGIQECPVISIYWSWESIVTLPLYYFYHVETNHIWIQCDAPYAWLACGKKNWAEEKIYFFPVK